MMVIHKYRLPFMEVSRVDMPEGAKIIRVSGLDGAIWIWAIVDTTAEMVRRVFRLYKTGGEMPDNALDLSYLGCGAIFVQMELMMYVFETVGGEVEPCQTVPLFDWKEHQEKGDDVLAPAKTYV